MKQETFIQILDSVPEKEITHTCKPVFLTLRMAAHIRKLKKKIGKCYFFIFFFENGQSVLIYRAKGVGTFIFLAIVPRLCRGLFFHLAHESLCYNCFSCCYFFCP